MGAEFYSYWVPGECEPAAALRRLRAETFASGAFRGADLKPASPELAAESAGASGTGSILDIVRIAESEEPGAANGLDSEEMEMYFNTRFPTRQAIVGCDPLAQDIGSGSSRYIAAYENGKCAGLVFMGYSFD